MPNGIVNYSILPPHMQGGMRRYIEEGIEGGNFMQAVLRNKLVQAFGAADEFNTYAMKDWASFLYNEAPRLCWGDDERVAAWVKRGGLNGYQREREGKSND